MRLIDADALAKRVHDDIPPVTDKVNYLASWHLIDAIDDAPTIEAEPVKHGRWIDGAENFTCGNHNAECSVCHCNVSWMGCDEDFNYCPNCGAKMDLEET